MMNALIPLSFAALASAAPFGIETIHKDTAPVISSTNAETVPDSYIVVFKNHVDEEAAATHQLWVKDAHVSAESSRTELRKRSQFPITENIFEGIKHTYNIAGGFLGYSGHFDEDIIEKVRRHPDVSTDFAYFRCSKITKCARRCSVSQTLRRYPVEYSSFDGECRCEQAARYRLCTSDK